MNATAHGHVEIVLSNGMVALVDEADAHLVRHRWRAYLHRKTFYVIREKMVGGRRIRFQLHREVLGLTDPAVQVDHRNGNGLDCRRSNLRVATPTENARNRAQRSDNTSGFKGVHQRPGYQRWRAYIYTGGKQISLGDFRSAADAALAYDGAARRMFGAFAALNFPGENERGA